MYKLFILTAVFSIALAGFGHAEYRTLNWDDGTAVSMETQESLGHSIEFFRQPDWDKTFSQMLHLYGQRYGEVGNHLVSIVIFGPQTENSKQYPDDPDSLVIYATVQVKMAEFPAEPGWIDIPMEVVDLPDYFWVSVFTRSKKDFGVRIGRTGVENTPSFSCSGKPGNPELQETANLVPWKEGGNWMIRMEVSPTPEEQVPILADDLTGSSFTAYDDGVADGFYSFQRGGPYLHIKNNYAKKVDRVYFYAYVDGDWYNTDRKAGVYLLDERRRIVARTQLPFSRYNSDASWNYVSFDGVNVPDEFYVLIEPFNRPGTELMLGYDNTGANQRSDFGTVGVLYDWSLDIPKDNTNWMIRVEYK